jgi:hypothetical protein
MPPDQAAGLRRRNRDRPLRCSHCFFEQADSTLELARALHRLGQRCLLVDLHGRLFAESAPRSLFDWRQQLERGQLNVLPLACGDGWHAPGARADEPALRRLAQAYDQLVFDVAPEADAPEWMANARHTVLLEVRAAAASMLRAYALLKTLSAIPDRPDLHLLGDAAACGQVRAAASHFLPPSFVRAVRDAVPQDDAISVLAVRMTGWETGVAARH